jgi:polysaccharide biosynthesis/export protein
MRTRVLQNDGCAEACAARRRWRQPAHLAAVVAAFCALQTGAMVEAEEPRPYIIGPKDVIAVSVFNQPQLTGRYVVESDGLFTFPLLGRLTASGLTLRALEDQLRERLARGYLKDPQVTVTIDQYRSQQIFVMGEVRQPGPVQLTGPITLLEALARAGSITDRAGMEALIVRSPESPSTPDAAALERAQRSPGSETARVNLQSLQSGELTLNVALWPGDTVFVPRAEPVVVTGQVKSAGEYVLRRSMTIRQVLALAGGITDRGSTRRIQILRQVDGVETTIDASLQDAVRPGDTVVVRERLF